MPDGHNQDIGELKASVDFLREGQERVERRMEEGFSEIKELFREGHGKHSERIRALEGWRDRLSGAKGVIMALWGSLVALALAGIALLRDWVGGK